MQENKGFTVVSLFPVKVEGVKPGLIPNVFDIPASDGSVPTVLFINQVKKMITSGADDQFIDYVDYSVADVAKSIAEDFITGLPQVSDDIRPAVFVVEGKVLPEDFTDEPYFSLYKKYWKRQAAWWIKIIEDADIQWMKSGGNFSNITDLHREACKQTGIERDWYIPNTFETPDLKEIINRKMRKDGKKKKMKEETGNE